MRLDTLRCNEYEIAAFSLNLFEVLLMLLGRQRAIQLRRFDAPVGIIASVLLPSSTDRMT
jgi:hypothetical protein